MKMTTASPVLQARQADELSVMEGDDVQVVEDGDVEDWLKVAPCSLFTVCEAKNHT